MSLSESTKQFFDSSIKPASEKIVSLNVEKSLTGFAASVIPEIVKVKQLLEIAKSHSIGAFGALAIKIFFQPRDKEKSIYD